LNATKCAFPRQWRSEGRGCRPSLDGAQNLVHVAVSSEFGQWRGEDLEVYWQTLVDGVRGGSQLVFRFELICTTRFWECSFLPLESMRDWDLLRQLRWRSKRC